MKNFIKGIILTGIGLGCSTGAVQPELSDEIKLALQETLQDEYKAQTTYQKVLETYGPNVRPFSNIIEAEKRHASALERLFGTYKLTPPSPLLKPSDIPVYASIKAGCAACYEAEIENVALYDKYLRLDLPTDVRTVFLNNRAASLNNHLPAFKQCKE